MYKVTTILLAVLLVIGLAGLAHAADTEGKISKVSDKALTVTDKDGKDHSFDLANDTEITLDGKKATAKDLKAGQKAKVEATGKKASKVEATS